MAVHQINTIVLLFPNQEWVGTATDVQLNAVVAQVQPNISYALNLNENLRTLSTHYADKSGEINGFLYVPEISHDNPCFNVSKEYIPANVTRRANLPPTDFTLVAIAPWINAECTKAFLDTADGDPMRAFIFYLPDNGTTQPPCSTSSIWDLGGDGWRLKHEYPVYAVPSNVGQEMIHQLSLYSGNLTSVPYGHQISELPGVDPRDYVRMYTGIRMSTAVVSTYPVLFVLIVAMLFLLLGLTSATMHLIWRLRKRSLQRRVASGEVNLEALGIKRLRVSPEVIQKLPLFTYNVEGEGLSSPVSHGPQQNSPSPSAAEQDTITAGSHTSPNQTLLLPSSEIAGENADPGIGSPLAHYFLPYSQPTCPICLEDFESGITSIRELPCGHIYHPNCIDTFLNTSSSLCPMCKQSVLPRGCCPITITYGMVRRERNIRRIQSRVLVTDEEDYIELSLTRSRMRRYRVKLRETLRRSTASNGLPNSISLPMDPGADFSVNLMSMNTNVSVLGNVVPETLERGLTRQDIAQQRIRELAARRSPDSDANVGRSKWQITVSRMFPGFG